QVVVVGRPLNPQPGHIGSNEVEAERGRGCGLHVRPHGAGDLPAKQHAETTAHDGLAFAGDVVGESDPRSEVDPFVGLVRVVDGAYGSDVEIGVQQAVGVVDAG